MFAQLDFALRRLLFGGLKDGWGKSLNCFLFRLYRHNTTEKQWYRPNRLQGIAYLLELKGGASHTYEPIINFTCKWRNG